MIPERIETGQSVRAELLSVGTELLLGEIVDTNSAWLAADLARRGVDVYWSQRVGDNLGRVSHAIRSALARSDLLVMCGGLGPTDDDLSREAIAEVVGETPVVDAGLETDLRTRFASFSRTMPERNLKQAWLIPSAEALPNPRGTAPGWLVRLAPERVGGLEKVVVALPGPPRELTRMWTQEVVPRLKLPSAALFARTFKTQGVGESAVAEVLGVLTLQANPSVATYARRDGVHVRVAAKAATAEQAYAIAEPALAQVETGLKAYIWGRDEDDLAALILQALASRGKTLVSSEVFSGGMLAETLGRVAAVRSPYLGGVVAYGAQLKEAFGVPKELLTAPGETSREAARALAEGAARHFGADYGVATGVAAEPSTSEGDPASSDPASSDPVFEVQLALVGAGIEDIKTLRLPGLDRDWLRERATTSALALLWSHLRLTT